MLKFSPAKHNAKLAELNLGRGYTFSLLSGWSCPHAKECLSKVFLANNNKRILIDGKHNRFRCFSASQEVLYPNLFKQREYNFNVLRDCKTRQSMVRMIAESLPKNADFIRMHVGGDFYNQDYMGAWVDVASIRPNILFYGYTKSLPEWLRLYDYINKVENFVLTASYGGTHDHLIDQYGLRSAKVVFSVEEAEALGLEIDHDDSHAADRNKKSESFALLLHGRQAKGTEASKALSKLGGLGSYGKGSKTPR